MTKRRRSPKLLVGASFGGHANDLRTLLDAAEGLWPIEPEAYVTTMEMRDQGLAVPGQPVYMIGEADRRTPLQVLAVGWRALRVVLRERPSVVVTTGAMPLAALCVWAKLFGAKVVWIDCVSQVESLSLSGKGMRFIADLCLTQWPDVAARYRNVEYAGELL